jgi:hypothetical protein
LVLKDDDEQVAKNRVHRIMRKAKIKAVRAYKRHAGFSGIHKNK